MKGKNKMTAKDKKQMLAWENVSFLYDIEEELPESKKVKLLIKEGLNIFKLQKEDENKLSGDMFETARDNNPSMELTKTTWVDLVKFKKNVNIGKTDEKEQKRLRNKINNSLYKAALTTEQLNSILEGREQKLLVPNETSDIDHEQYEISENKNLQKTIKDASTLKERIDVDYKEKFKELRMAFAWVTQLDQYLFKTFVEIEYYKNGNPHGGNKKPILSKEIKLLKTLLQLMDSWDMKYVRSMLSRHGLKVEYTNEKHFAADDYSEEAEKWLGVDARYPKEEMDEPNVKQWHVIVEYNGYSYLIDRIKNEILDVINPKEIPIRNDWVTDFDDFNIRLPFYTEVENEEKLKLIKEFIENFNYNE